MRRHIPVPEASLLSCTERHPPKDIRTYVRALERLAVFCQSGTVLGATAHLGPADMIGH